MPNKKFRHESARPRGSAMRAQCRACFPPSSSMLHGYVVLEGALTPAEAELAMLRTQACCLTRHLAAAGRDLCDEQCVTEVIEPAPDARHLATYHATKR